MSFRPHLDKTKSKELTQKMEVSQRMCIQMIFLKGHLNDTQRLQVPRGQSALRRQEVMENAWAGQGCTRETPGVGGKETSGAEPAFFTKENLTQRGNLYSKPQMQVFL